jgi:hypothetical protein
MPNGKSEPVVRDRRSPWLIALACIIILASLAGMAAVTKARLEAAFGDRISLLERIGLAEAIGEGFEFQDITTVRHIEGGEDVIRVEGVIVNTRPVSRPVPNVIIVLTNLEKKEVMSSVTRAKETELPSAGRTTFTAALRNPPPTARKIDITYTRKEVDPEAK